MTAILADFYPGLSTAGKISVRQAQGGSKKKSGNINTLPVNVV
jgi:hypothetical protein